MATYKDSSGQIVTPAQVAEDDDGIFDAATGERLTLLSADLEDMVGGEALIPITGARQIALRMASKIPGRVEITDYDDASGVYTAVCGAVCVETEDTIDEAAASAIRKWRAWSDAGKKEAPPEEARAILESRGLLRESARYGLFIGRIVRLLSDNSPVGGMGSRFVKLKAGERLILPDASRFRRIIEAPFARRIIIPPDFAEDGPRRVLTANGRRMIVFHTYGLSGGPSDVGT